MGHRIGRARASVLAASLVGGSADVLDFLLPLWAGVELRASPAQVGALVALELAVSVLTRPLAGWLADTRERTRVAAVGALLYGLGCLGYAVAPGLALAWVAAAATGAGGALLWVSVRAVTAERLAGDDAAFARLFSAVALASWVTWVPAMVLLPAVGYRGLFACFGVVCLVGAGLLVVPVALPGAGPVVPGGRVRDDVRRFWPLLAVVALTGAAESGVGLLLLLHLQGAFDLEVVEIALVFLPGGIALTVLPGPLHRLTRRWGRRPVYAVALCGSAVFAASLAAAPGPLVIAGAWVLTSAAWAALTPIHEAAVAELSATSRTGRGMSLLSNAALAGGAVGSASAGALYGATSWAVVCVTLAAVLLVGAAAGPWALRRIGLRDRPSPVPVAGDPAR
ncbi:MFS transporter [Cellulomonas triticagri]|uniref:MFS transporter n=1 Tax=Cellulomonas triticagri TaxID=2483352 RepID=A0A3M2JFI2_9CELL|nr:MFS transporter [Cellulomonas triticagri]RMI09058.1 MFS transporter [Cellulomonas triticagri]